MRNIVLRVQHHECRPKCFMSKGEPCEDCKYGCPRRRNHRENSKGEPARGCEGCVPTPTTPSVSRCCSIQVAWSLLL